MSTLDSAHRPKVLHTMLRVRDLERSLAFYVGKLGMGVRARYDYPEQKYSLVFVSYDTSRLDGEIELTWNWDGRDYDLGNAYGHVALGMADIATVVRRLADHGVKVTRPVGPRPEQPDQIIAFVVDPDGYKVELIETP